MFELFFSFFKISAMTLGGGYAMVPVMIKFLEKKGWMSEKEFMDILTIAQSLPGPIAFNTSRLVGEKLKGTKGAIVCSIAVIIPPFFAIILASYLFNKFSQNIYVKYYLKGIYAAALGLIFGIVVKIFKNQSWTFFKVILLIIGVLSILFNNNFVLPVFILIVSLNYIYENGRVKND